MTNAVILFLNMGTPEIMLIMFVALLLFGGKKLPELARGLGRGIREFKDASDSVKREIHNNINSVTEEPARPADDYTPADYNYYPETPAEGTGIQNSDAVTDEIPEPYSTGTEQDPPVKKRKVKAAP